MKSATKRFGEPISKALAKTRSEFDRDINPDYGMGMKAFGESIYDESETVITYDGRQDATRKRLQESLLADIRFEHLKDREAENLTWQYVRAISEEAGVDEQLEAMASTAQEPHEEQFWFWLERFTTETRFSFSGVEFMPPSEYHEPIDPEAQKEGSLILVAESGTNTELMRSRARSKADVALRRLRVVLDEDREIYPDQLRFYVGHRFKFPDGTFGMRRLTGTPLHLGIGQKQAASTSEHLISSLPLEPENDVEQQIEIATNWLDRAMLADEVEIAMLYRFFALEALFTKKRKKKKNDRTGLGKLITIRRATLGLLVEDKYMEPFYKPHLYNKVRSRAVHGETAAKFSKKLADSLAWDTRKALIEYVKFVKDNDFTERWKVIAALENSPRRANVLKTLKHHDPKTWKNYE